jgi:hypothetical protein
MAKREMVVQYVDSLLKRLTGNSELRRDPDGDWPFNLQSSLMFVRVTAEDQPTIRVWGVAAKAVPAGEKLFQFLNDINQQVQFSRAFWGNDGAVFIATELVGESIDVEELDTALRRVASGTELFGPKIVEACGGTLVPPPKGPAGQVAGGDSTPGRALDHDAAGAEATGGYL